MSRGFEVADQSGRTHNQVAELLSAFIDDEVSAEERAVVEAHLATCATCAEDLAGLRQTVNLLSELPQVAAPRAFTLRESDIQPLPAQARPAWWQLPWVRGLAGAAAILVCVAVAGVVLLGRGGIPGLPAAPQQLAMEEAAPTAAVTNLQADGEQAVEAEMALEAEPEMEEAEAQPAPPTARGAEQVPAEPGIAQETAAEPPALEEKASAEEAETFMATPLQERIAAGAAPSSADTTSPLPSATPAPMPTVISAPAAEAMSPREVTPTPTLLEVEDLNLEIEPGVIRVRGRLPLPEGRQMLAALWRNGQPVEWATNQSRGFVVEADGGFFLALMAQADIPDFDLLAAEPADYEIRIRPVDPPAPVEIRIPFDTYSPPAPPATNTP